MEDKFDYAYAFTAEAEGGLSDVKEDRGGITAYGVCIELLRDMASRGGCRRYLEYLGVKLPITRESVKTLTKEQARQIFRREFWTLPGLDVFPKRVACCLFDMAVNHGWRNAVKIAQRGYNAVIGPYGVPLVEDGKMGPKTKAALRQETAPLLRAIIDSRRLFFRRIVEHNPSQKVFIRGWLNRCDNLQDYLEV